MNVTVSLVPCSPFINQWFSLAMTYETLRERMLSGEFNRLSPQDKAFILAYVNKQGWIVQALKQQDNSFFMALIENGVTFSENDAAGGSVWNLMTPEVFQWLFMKGALPPHEECVPQFLVRQSFHCVFGHSMEKWKQVLLTLIPIIPLEDYCIVERKYLADLINMGKNDANAQKVCREAAINFMLKRPQDVLAIARKLLSTYDHQEFREDFLELIKAGFVKDPLIEQIVTDPEILFWNTNNKIFFEALGRCWQPQGDLLSLSQTVRDLRFGIYINAVLNTESLDKAARLYSHLREFPDMDSVDEAVKKRLFDHIQDLQAKEKSTIWESIGNEQCYYKDLLQMRKLGFDPNWVNVHRRTFLFTRQARQLSGQMNIGFNPGHVDANGDNALEYHCRSSSVESFYVIEALTSLGIKLSDGFPNVKECRMTFRHNPYLQAVLGFCLLHSNKSTRDVMRLSSMSKQDKILLREAACKDPELASRLQKCLGLEMPGGPGHKRSSDVLDRENWKNRYHPADACTLDSYIEEQYTKELDLKFLATFWEGIVPSEVVGMIPESPIASLVLGAMQVQHQQFIVGKIKKPVGLDTLLRLTLGHDDMVHLNRHLFENPGTMRIFVENYLRAKLISVQPGGGSKTNYGKTVYCMISTMGELLQLPSWQMDLPEWHNRLLNAFHARVPAETIETLHVAKDACIKLVGRTVVVTSQEECNAFKFLKPGEKYDYFSQEHSVCKALNSIAGQFQSRIIEPVGVFAVRQLPDTFFPFQERLGELANRFVFHYKARPETYMYLQEVSPENYREARNKTLHDAARLIRLGVYPDLAAMFHNHEQSRRYVLLVDLMVRLERDDTFLNIVSPFGGGGRLETPFVKTKYPNSRLTGMTDWRDAVLYYGWSNTIGDSIKDIHVRLDKMKPSVKCFYQMNALSNVFLIDMVILAERYMEKRELQWQNPELNEQFGRELREGFAYLFASYSGQPYPQSLRFAEHCGIDWTLAAKQIAFWLDTGPNGYPGFVARGEIPEGLYEEGIKLEVNMEGAHNFDREHGFRTNGAQDIGVYNGPLALDQFEKAAYLFFNAIALAEPLNPKKEEVVRFHGDDHWDSMGD